MENVWIIQSYDDEHNEVIGAFEGNLFEILLKRFTKKPEYIRGDEYISVYSLEYLLDRAKLFSGTYERNAEPVLVSSVNGYTFGNSEIKNLVKYHYSEFRKKYPEIGLHVSREEVEFKEHVESIKKEISGLSPETLEYIRKHGI